MNNKIKFIETILAEQSTESELMKKYYFGLNSNKKKGKIGDFTHIKNRMGDAYRKAKGQKKERKSIHTEVIPRSKPLFQDTTSTVFFIKIKPLSNSRDWKIMNPFAINTKMFPLICNRYPDRPIKESSYSNKGLPTKK